MQVGPSLINIDGEYRGGGVVEEVEEEKLKKFEKDKSVPIHYQNVKTMTCWRLFVRQSELGQA